MVPLYLPIVQFIRGAPSPSTHRFSTRPETIRARAFDDLFRGEGKGVLRIVMTVASDK